MGASALQEWLDNYCDSSESAVAGVVVLKNQEEGKLVVAAQQLTAASRGEDLVAAARASIDCSTSTVSREQNPVVPEQHSTQVVSLPMLVDSRTIGAIALEVPADEAMARPILIDLERAATALARALGSSGSARPTVDASTVLQLQATILSHEKFDEAATAFATELASLLRVERVAVGFRENGYATVVAVSRSADFHIRAELFRLLADAMDEAIEQTASICFPDDEKPRITIAHAEFVRRQGGSLSTIPLMSGQRAFGALTLERGGNAPLGNEEIAQCENIACILGPILELRRNDERPWRHRAARTVRALVARVTGPGQVKAKAIVFGGMAALAVSLLLPVEYRVSAPARVEGSIQQAVVAPTDGFLTTVHVKPGDHVVAGQVLIELAEQDLRLERRKLEGELAQHENAFGAALARADRTQFVIAQAKADEARAHLGLVEEQLVRGRIRAPFDGVVISGDLSQSLGAPVRKGDGLVTLAPTDQYRLIVEVDERDIAYVRNGQSGALALGALPGNTVGFQVARITSIATARDARNYFEVEGKFNTVPASIRPGLMGVAKISSENRSLAWIWTHRFVDWVRLAAWTWGL
jgi:multidrug resistance efflux pump